MALARRIAGSLSSTGTRRGRAHCALTCLLAASCAFALPTPAAFGEGSVDVNAGPGTRTRQALATAAAIYTVVRVYARAGETLQMGSSAMGLGTTSNILVYAPGTSFASATNPAVPATYPGDPVFATRVFNCRTAQPGAGRIGTRAQELAGPAPNAGGYTPCQYVAPSAGIYSVLLAPVSLSGNGDPGTVNAPSTAASQAITISIWDVTVRSAGGAVQPGRVFTNRAHLRTSFATGSASDFSAYVYTCTGYLYTVRFSDHAGGNWIMAVDNRGVIATPTGNLTFASFRFAAVSGGPLYPQARAPLLSDPDVVQDNRHPVFLHQPDPLTVSGPGGLQAERGCSPVPVTAATAPLANVAFTGSGGQAGGTDRGSGGTISFTSPAILEGNAYTVALDLDGNGGFADPADVTTRGLRLGSGANSFVWNGLDGTGAPPGCGTHNYRIQSTLSDVHFTQEDVENSGGTQIERLTLPSDPAFPNRFALSYNDIDPYKGIAVTNATPTAVTNGISSPSFHRWTATTGDVDWVDTWASLPGQAVSGTFKVLCADLAIAKSAPPSPAVPGTPLTYQLVVTNNGPDAAAAVQVSDPLPAGLTFVSGGPGCSASGQNVTCALGTMAPGASQTLTVTADLASAVNGQVTNTAAVTSPTPDPDQGNNSSTVAVPLEGQADLSIDKAASTSTAAPGGQVLYTLVIENHGTSDATGVTVTDAPPAGITLRSAISSQGSCTVTAAGLSCSLAGLVAGGAAQILVTAQVDEAATGALTNAARVTGDQRDPDPSNNEEPETVTVPAPPPSAPQPPAELAITKQGDRTGAVDQPLTYRIVVGNHGPTPATAVKVTDTTSTPARTVSIRTRAGNCRRSVPVTCSLATIPPGGRVPVTVVIEPRIPGPLRNAASVTGNGLDPKTTNNLVVIATRVKLPLALTKHANRRTVAAGKTVTYTLRLHNPSTVAIRNVRTCDSPPYGLEIVRATARAKLTNGRYCWTTTRLRAGKTKTYKLTARALTSTNGNKTNRATATSPNTRTARAKRTVKIYGGVAPIHVTG